jgi:hypothetical protein
VDAAVTAPLGSTVSVTAFHPGLRPRVTVVDGAAPATAVRVGVSVRVAVTVGVEVTVAVEVGVDVRVAVAVPVAIEVGHAGAAVGTDPIGVAVAVREVDVNDRYRFKTMSPPGRFGDVMVMSTTPMPDDAEARATKVMRPFVPVEPQVVEIETGLVADVLT